LERIFEMNNTDKTNLKNNISIFLRALSLISIYLFVRIIYVFKSSLNGDEAIFGLMSISIGRGEEYPLYCWGAHYASALISYLAVPVMFFAGITPFALKITTLIYGIFLIPLIYISQRKKEGEITGTLSALYIAMPLPILLSYSVTANGGHTETYFLGFAIWILALGIIELPSAFLFFLFGLMCGLSFSILWLGIPFILSAIYILYSEKILLTKKSLHLASGFLIGILPFLYYNLVIAPAATFMRLGARALEVKRSGSVGEGITNRISGIIDWVRESVIGLNSIFAFPFPYGFLLSIIFIFSVIYGAYILTKKRDVRGKLVFAFVIALILFNFAGNLTRSRHWCILLFAAIPAWAGLNRRIQIFLFSAFIIIGGWFSIKLIEETKIDSRISASAVEIKRYGADSLIADYDLGYPISFELKGCVPTAAIAPLNPGDRRPDWTELVSRSQRPAVLLTFNDASEFIESNEPVECKMEYVGDRVLIFPKLDGKSAIERVKNISQ